MTHAQIEQCLAVGLDAVREAGGLVLAAANAQELNATLNSLLTGKILVEGP